VLTRSGDDLFSVTTKSPQDAQALASQLRDSGDWLEVIPGIDSVVLQFDAATYDGDDVRQTIESALAAGIEPLQISQSLVEIPVIYGGEYGPDLNALCEKIGMSADDVIALHTGREYTVDMIGFTPGFAFIGNLDERLRVPRRKEPRQRVEAGSVGIADERTGLYAMASPGGWTIIGRTPSRLFDPNAEQPFVLGAGTRVRFTAISADELNG
jgi:KipI family sensor histidine kinase inhibitor